MAAEFLPRCTPFQSLRNVARVARMPCPARYDGTAGDSERLKVALGKESKWQLSWNELRFREAGYPPPFSGTFAESRGTSQTSSQTSLTRRRSLMSGDGLRMDEFLVPRSPSRSSSSFASSLKASRSHGVLNPIHDGNAVRRNEDDRTWQARHATAPVQPARPPQPPIALRPRATPPHTHWCGVRPRLHATLCAPARARPAERHVRRADVVPRAVQGSTDERDLQLARLAHP